MSQELFYTSVPIGLKPGSKGFCTVATTAGMSAALVQRLEMLSGYREVYPPGDPRVEQNPIAWSHWRLNVGGRTHALLSRVCFAGMDYSQRANVFAHHLLLDSAEQSAAGPARVISQDGVMDTRWSGSPRVLPHGRQIPNGEDPPVACSTWAAATGDAGWAGVFAETAASDSSRVAYIIYAPGTNVLAMLREAMTLLPSRQRWLINFSTYFTELPAGMTCNWRCCIAGTQAAKEARRFATSGVVIDLTRACGLAPTSSFVEAARSGRFAAPEEKLQRPRKEGGEYEEETGKQAIETKRARHTLAGAYSDTNTSDQQPNDSSGEGAPLLAALPGANRPVFFRIVAIIWPLLVVSTVVAWHLSQESPRNREMSAKNSNLKKRIDDLTQKEDILTKKENELAGQVGALRQQVLWRNAYLNELNSTQSLTVLKVSGTLSRAIRDAVRTIRGGLGALNKPVTKSGSPTTRSIPQIGQSADVSVTTKPSTTPTVSTTSAPFDSVSPTVSEPAHAEIPRETFADIGGSQQTICEVGCPEKQIDLVETANRPSDIVLDADPKPAATVIVIRDVSTNEPIAKIELDQQIGKVTWASFGISHTEESFKDWIRGTAVRVYSSDGQIAEIARLKPPMSTIHKLDSAGGAPPQDLKSFVVASSREIELSLPAEMPSDWTATLDPAGNSAKFVCSSAIDSNFLVTFNQSNLTLDSTWAQCDKQQKDEISAAKAKRLSDEQAKNVHELTLQGIDISKTDDRKNEKGQIDDLNHQISENDARAARAKMADDKLRAIKPFTLQLRDKPTGMLLYEITCQVE